MKCSQCQKTIRTKSDLIRHLELAHNVTSKTKAWAEFAGLQEIPDTNPVQHIRLYHIKGDHRLRLSTVTIRTLISEGIKIPDLNTEKIQRELDLLDRLDRDDFKVAGPVSEYAKSEILKSMSFKIVPMEDTKP